VRRLERLAVALPDELVLVLDFLTEPLAGVLRQLPPCLAGPRHERKVVFGGPPIRLSANDDAALCFEVARSRVHFLYGVAGKPLPNFVPSKWTTR